MVCKEDVLSWFKDLESYKRIDVLYELLNMCLPFELRFLGSCVEEIGKHTYEDLRGQTITANDLEKLQKDSHHFGQGLLDENVRHRVLIYLSLLSSKNYSVANWLYKTVLRTEWLLDCVVKGGLKDENVQSEFLLLYVMAMHHPAFTFDQKLYFGKILTPLLEIKENNHHRISPKPSVYGYPPGFGYPTIKPVNPPPLPPEAVSTVPVKTSVTVPCIDETLHQQPPSLPHLPAGPLPPQDFVAWSHPGFPCRPPEVTPPFPPPAVSPLVSQSTSPIHSRNSSPHPTVVPSRLPPVAQPPPPPVEAIPVVAAPILGDPTNTFTFINLPPENVKLPDEDLNVIQLEDKLVAEPPCPPPTWVPAQPVVGTVLKEVVKQPNGMRFPHICPPLPVSKGAPPRPFLVEQAFQTLSLDGGDGGMGIVGMGGGGLLQRSNSSSSSSLNQSPPDTPTTTAAANVVVGPPPQSPAPTNGPTQQQQRIGVDTNKPRVNGIPPPAFVQQPPPPAPPPAAAPLVAPPPLCDTTSPPPTFNSCSVPYTYQTTFTAIPTRSMFPYNTQSYRPPFTTHFPSFQQTNDSSFPTYSYPYMSIIYSSPTYPRNCYNCGMLGHTGDDCTGQNIEDITQKKTYTIDYAAAPLPDADK